MAVMPLGEARDHLSEVVAEVERTHERVTLTRHGKAVAVPVSADDLEALEETLDILSAPKASEEIAQAHEDLAAGRTMSAAELKRIVAAKHG